MINSKSINVTPSYCHLVCYNTVGGDEQLSRGTDCLHPLGSRYPWNQPLRRKRYASLKVWYPPIRLRHNVLTQNTTITTYTESEKPKACNVKRKDSWLPDVMPCCWVIRSWHFEGNDQSKSKQYSSWMAWTLELMALQTFPNLHNHYIPEHIQRKSEQSTVHVHTVSSTVKIHALTSQNMTDCSMTAPLPMSSTRSILLHLHLIALSFPQEKINTFQKVTYLLF